MVTDGFDACVAAAPEASAQAPSTHHGRCLPRLEYNKSTRGASGVYLRERPFQQYAERPVGTIQCKSACYRPCASTWHLGDSAVLASLIIMVISSRPY